GTLIVNLAGCLLIGISFALAEQKNIIGPAARLFLMTGFLGGLTTFSSYGLESIIVARSETPWVFAANLVANNAGGFALVLAGMWLARTFL
ncbi:MAG TPA: CrcB family protein, partial [Candidatus Hydrogenedentes bacterium]|nr:CrcB family protein [Candidatus Hydrogenedentota bacterium]